MTQDPTKLSDCTLIIGAGAHVPYDFPTSMGLTEIVKKIYADRTTWTRINDPDPYGHKKWTDEAVFKHELCKLATKLDQFGGFVKSNDGDECSYLKSLNKFFQSFCESGVYSIDTYLSNREDGPESSEKDFNAEWGRRVIAYLISKIEADKLFGTHKFGWIQRLIDDQLKDGYKDFFDDHPKVISFNYDRYFERSIFKHLTNFHRLPEEAAKNLVESLGIIHVYGHLGCFKKWAAKIEDKDFYSQAYDNIKVIGESRSQMTLTKTKEEVDLVLKNTKKIYFLGYGFDKKNNELLFGRMDRARLESEKEIYTTNVKITKFMAAKIQENLGFTPEYLEMADKEEIDCEKLLFEKSPMSRTFRKQNEVIDHDYKLFDHLEDLDDRNS